MELELYTRISATASVVKEPHNTELMKHLRQFLKQMKRLFSQIWSEIGTIKIKNRQLVWVLTGISNDPNKTSYFFFTIRDYTRYNYLNYDMFKKRGRQQAIKLGRKCVSKRENSWIDNLIFTQLRKCGSLVRTQ